MPGIQNMMISRGPKMLSGAEDKRLAQQAEELKTMMMTRNHPGFRVQGPINPTELPMTATKAIFG